MRGVPEIITPTPAAVTDDTAPPVPGLSFGRLVRNLGNVEGRPCGATYRLADDLL